MTITLTVEEIRDFQSKVAKWGGLRAEVIKHTIITEHGGFVRLVNESALAKWDRENPFPKLIPSI